MTPYRGDTCRWGGLKLATFDEKCTITRKRYKVRHTDSIKVEEEVICDLSNNDVYDDLG